MKEYRQPQSDRRVLFA